MVILHDFDLVNVVIAAGLSCDLMGSRMKKVRVSVGIVFNIQGKVLISTREQNRSSQGYWEFPGGKAKAKENDLIALKRELKEELNIDVHQATPWLSRQVINDNTLLNISFWRICASQWSGDIKAREEQCWEFVWPTQLPDKNFLPNNREVIKNLMYPRQLFLRNSIFYDQEQTFYLLPYRESLSSTNKVYYLSKDYQNLSTQLDHSCIVVVVESTQQMREALDADALIWNIVSSNSYCMLYRVLKEGQFIPIWALNATAEETDHLNKLGIHGFAYRREIN